MTSVTRFQQKIFIQLTKTLILSYRSRYGTLTISNGQIVKQLGVVASKDVLDAEDYKEMDMD